LPTPTEPIEGKYEILEKMREGGMGAVYMVKHRLLDEIRVIKMMRPHLAQDKTLRERFKREAKTAIRLRHQNLAQLYDFSIDDEGNAYIVMEYIEGVNLFELMKVLLQPSLGLCLEIASQSLNVLGYLHRKDIVHRDISPDNIMLARDDEKRPIVKLIDLGIAKETKSDSGLTQAGTFLGKVRYSSPEHFKTQEGSVVEARSDLYSFGIVLYQLLTGKYPIRGNTTTAVIAGHLLHDPMPFDESDPKNLIPEKLQELVIGSLSKELDDRPRSAQAFRRVVDELATDLEIEDLELERLFDLPKQATQRIEIPKPGSTQDHLNKQFGAGTTPAPEEGSESVGSPPPLPEVTERDIPQQVKALLLGAEKLIEAQHYDEARLQIDAVRELDPESSEVVRLEKLVDRLDEKLQARRKEAVERIEALIRMADYSAAAKELAMAHEALGSHEALDKLASALAEAKKQAATRAKEASAKFKKAEKALKEDRFENAIKLLKEVLELDSNHTEAANELKKAEKLLAQKVEEDRKKEEIEKTCREIGIQIERENLDEAKRAIAVARKVYGKLEQFDALESAMEAKTEGIRKTEASKLVESATKLIAEELFEDALGQLKTAREFGVEVSQVDELCKKAEEGLRFLQEQRQREAAVNASIAAVERLVLTGRLETAYTSLETAVKEHGDFEKAAALRSEIENAIELRREQKRQAFSLLERARSLLEENDFNSTRSALEEARALALDNPEVNDLLEQAETDLSRKIRQNRRMTEVERAAQSIAAQLDANNVDEAERELQVAERLFGATENLEALRARLLELKAAKQSSRVEELLKEALTKKTSFPEVIKTLEQALEIDPTNEKVQRLLSETRASHYRFQQEKRAREISEVMAKIDSLIADGKMKEALEELEKAVQKIGDFQEARALRNRLQKALE
jgi:serine/threonine-protein kinase